MTRLSEPEVRAALAGIVEPVTQRPLGALNLVRAVAVGGDIRLTVAVPAPRSSGMPAFTDEVEGALRTAGADRVSVDLRGLTDEERRDLRTQLRADPAGGLTNTRVLAISSGKGGVGKSSLAVNMAVALARRGQRTAIMDADVYGFSIPRMLGITESPVVLDDLVLPPRAHGVAVVSVALFADEQTPVIWRGPMLHKMLSQFVHDVFWDRPDWLLVDMPPGTGDVAMTMAEFLPATEMVVVTTPQPAAQKVAQRAAYMAQKIDVQLTGVVENMSWFTGRDGVRYELFGAGGGALLAQEVGAPLLGQVPFVPALREGADRGRPIAATEPDSEAGRAIEAVVDAVTGQRRARRLLPLLGS